MPRWEWDVGEDEPMFFTLTWTSLIFYPLRSLQLYLEVRRATSMQPDERLVWAREFATKMMRDYPRGIVELELEGKRY